MAVPSALNHSIQIGGVVSAGKAAYQHVQTGEGGGGGCGAGGMVCRAETRYSRPAEVASLSPAPETVSQRNGTRAERTVTNS